MIAPRSLPESFVAWNRKWGAPDGRAWPLPASLRFNRFAMRYRGRFAHQPNSETRRFEYPWAHAAIERQGRNLSVVEIGGGLSGMQFVLAAEGHRVINVDPAKGASSWGFSPDAHSRLCRLYRAPVTLMPCTLPEARLPSESADVIVSISVLEHLPDTELEKTAQAIRRILRRDGIVVMTVDLFLDLRPFTAREVGDWGRNIDVRRFLKTAGLELTFGDRDELSGFAAFDAEAISARASRYLVSRARSTAQCIIARRRGDDSQDL